MVILIKNIRFDGADDTYTIYEGSLESNKKVVLSSSEMTDLIILLNKAGF